MSCNLPAAGERRCQGFSPRPGEVHAALYKVIPVSPSCRKQRLISSRQGQFTLSPLEGRTRTPGIQERRMPLQGLIEPDDRIVLLAPLGQQHGLAVQGSPVVRWCRRASAKAVGGNGQTRRARRNRNRTRAAPAFRTGASRACRGRARKPRPPGPSCSGPPAQRRGLRWSNASSRPSAAAWSQSFRAAWNCLRLSKDTPRFRYASAKPLSQRRAAL